MNVMSVYMELQPAKVDKKENKSSWNFSIEIVQDCCILLSCKNNQLEVNTATCDTMQQIQYDQVQTVVIRKICRVSNCNGH